MSSRKFNRRYKKGSSSRNGYKRVTKYVNYNNARKALHIALMTKKLLNVEYKFHDVTASGQADFNGSLATLNTIAQGTTDTTRVGDSLLMKNLTFRIRCSAQITTWFRFIVFIDKQNQILTVADYLQQIGSAFAVNSPKNHDKRFLSRVLLDKTYAISINGKQNYESNGFVKIDKHVQFQAGSTTINNNEIKLLVISSDAPAANNPSFVMYYRISYIDN